MSPTALGAAGFVVLLVAQGTLEPPRVSLAAGCLLVLGVALWALAQTRGEMTLGQGFLPWTALQHRLARPLPFTVAVAFAAIAWLGSSGGEYTAANVAAWIGALGAWCWAWWPHATGERAAPFASLARSRGRHVWWLLALGLVLAAGAFFRFAHPNDVPSDPISDHAEKLLDIHDLDRGERPIFFPRNTGREPAQFYVTFGLMKIFGLSLSFETLKLGTALIGLLAIPAVFLFAQEIGGRATGLFAAALFAVSAWSVETARWGLRYPYAQLATAVVLWLLFRYLRRGDRRDALACGVAIGFGLHGYTPFRVVPVLVVALLALAMLYRRKTPHAPSSLLAGGGLIFATAFVASLPLARYAFDHPDLVTYRTRTRVDGDLGWTDTLSTFVENNWNALLAFNWRGDPAPINGLGLQPFLDEVTGAALLAGVSVLAWQLIRRRSFAAAALLLSAPFLLAPSTASVAFPHENPAVNRLGTAVPLVFTVAALPFAFLWHSLRVRDAGGWKDALRIRPSACAVTIALVATALGVAAVQNYRTYFRDYARQYRAFVPNAGEIAAAMQGRLGQGFSLDRMFLLGYPHWVDGRNVGFALGAPEWYVTNSIVPGDPIPKDAGPDPLLFVLHPSDAGRRKELTARFPGGEYRVVSSEVLDHEFALYSTGRT